MIPMFAISDVVWQAGIAGVVTIVMAWIAHKSSSKSDELKAEVVKTAEKVEAVAVVSDKIHVLTNSRMGVELKLNAVNSKRLAIITKTPEDIEASEIADKALAEHDKQQALVDSKV